MDKNLKSVAAFTFLYLAVASYFALTLQNWEFIFYIAVVVILAAVIALVHSKVKLSAGVLWLLSIWGLLHMIGGLVHLPAGWAFNGDKNVFYSLWIIDPYLKYDQLVHAYGFGTSTWVCWQALRAASPKILPSFGILTLCALGGMGLGAANEIIEFIAVLAIPDTNVGGYENTGWDLVANMAGCVLAAVLIKVSTKQNA